MAAMNPKSDTYKTVISPLEFIRKLPVIIWRAPGLLYNLLKGLYMISGNASISWGSILEDIDNRFPDRTAIKSPDGEMTYRELNAGANQYAHFLIASKVSKGDVITLCMETRPELLVLYCACAKLGAVCSMININQRGESLAHSFNMNKGKIAIIGQECLDHFIEAQAAMDLSETILYTLKDAGGKKVPESEDIAMQAQTMPVRNPDSTGSVALDDAVALVYTSGTTGGLPKAAVITHKRIVSALFWWGCVVDHVRPGDTVYVPLPFFHTNALCVGWPAALCNGAAVAVPRKFSARGFLDDVRKFGATHFIYVGELCRYVMSQPEQPDDSNNPLRVVIGNGLKPDIWKPFQKRFGIRKVCEFYGASEGVGIFTNIFNFDYSVGTSLTSYAIARYDIESEAPVRNEKEFLICVARGEPGLLIMKISKKAPFAGYSDKKKNEEKIIRNAFRKGDAWFNTGDVLRDMGFRHAQFVDRLGDTFRWKGENVATMEVEKVFDVFPGIAPSVVYGVAMPSRDGKAGMAAIIGRGNSHDLSALTAHLKASLPKYAVPLFIRFVDDFQWTATHKIKKSGLKSEGFDPGRIISGEIYVLLPGAKTYVSLNEDLYKNILAGNYKF
jgi:citronellyl-CoA synthetase